jgi:hypothetical protein
VKTEALAYCAACAAEISVGGLRCASCGASFRGRKAVPQLHATPNVEASGSGFSMTVDVDELMLDDEFDEAGDE